LLRGTRKRLATKKGVWELPPGVVREGERRGAKW